MSDDRIGDETLSAISEALQLNKNITHLNLSRNSVREKGTKAISEGFESQPEY